MKRKRLTLLELIIVISIILVFFSIGYFVFFSVLESSRITVCRSNLKQIGLALLAYEEDWGSFPKDPYSRPYDYLLPYLKSEDVFVCPSNPTLQTKTGKVKLFSYLFARYVVIPIDGKWQKNGKYLNAFRQLRFVGHLKSP